MRNREDKESQQTIHHLHLSLKNLVRFDFLILNHVESSNTNSSNNGFSLSQPPPTKSQPVAQKPKDKPLIDLFDSFEPEQQPILYQRETAAQADWNNQLSQQMAIQASIQSQIEMTTKLLNQNNTGYANFPTTSAGMDPFSNRNAINPSNPFEASIPPTSPTNPFVSAVPSVPAGNNQFSQMGNASFASSVAPMSMQQFPQSGMGMNTQLNNNSFASGYNQQKGFPTMANSNTPFASGVASTQGFQNVNNPSFVATFGKGNASAQFYDETNMQNQMQSGSRIHNPAAFTVENAFGGTNQVLQSNNPFSSNLGSPTATSNQFGGTSNAFPVSKNNGYALSNQPLQGSIANQFHIPNNPQSSSVGTYGTTNQRPPMGGANHQIYSQQQQPVLDGALKQHPNNPFIN